jgi:hypothetical protein
MSISSDVPLITGGEPRGEAAGPTPKNMLTYLPGLSIFAEGPDSSDLLVASLGRWHISRIPAGEPGHRLPCHR